MLLKGERVKDFWDVAFDDIITIGKVSAEKFNAFS
jgi:hypothetical protein